MTLPLAFRLVPFALLSASLGAQVASEVTIAPAAVEAIDELVTARREAMGVPGMAVAVGWDGAVRYSKGFGLANVELEVAVTSSTRFRTASIAKAMTAVAVMQLVERGELALEDDIRKHVPAYPEKPWVVTVRDVLCHQSGIRHYVRSGEGAGKESYRSLTDSIAIFGEDDLLFEPGTKFSYTTYGYTLLGCAVENLSGRSYEDHLRKHVWQPAGMEHTGLDHHWEVVPGRASGYKRLALADRTRVPETLYSRLEEGDLIRAPLHDTSMKVAGGGVLSTAEDLVRFGMAMLDDELVNAATRERMWTVQKTRDGKETRVGLGWFRVRGGGADMVGHSGGQAGTTCMLVIDRDAGTVAAVMTNLQSAVAVPMLAAAVARRARS